MFNKVVLVGNLSRDVEVRFSQSGTTISKTALATNRKFKDQQGQSKEEVMFIDITFFGRTAEIAQQYLRRGSKVLIEGRLQFDQWVDQNNQKRSKHSVVVESMQMLGSKEQGDVASSTPKSPARDETPKLNTMPPPPDDIGISEEDIPF